MIGVQHLNQEIDTWLLRLDKPQRKPWPMTMKNFQFQFHPVQPALWIKS